VHIIKGGVLTSFLFWHLDNQTFTIGDDPKIDRLKVNVMKNGESENITFYFDLTDLE